MVKGDTRRSKRSGDVQDWRGDDRRLTPQTKIFRQLWLRVGEGLGKIFGGESDRALLHVVGIKSGGCPFIEVTLLVSLV